MSSGNGNNPRNPLLAVDALVRMPEGLILIERENPPRGWALPGGFVEYGETVEQAVRRELREETGLELDNLRQWHVFSDPDRDPRQHVVSVVFHADGKGVPRAATDARNVQIFPLDQPLPSCTFDHDEILTKAKKDKVI